MNRIEEMRQQFLDVIEADFGRSFEVFPDPEDLTLEAPGNTDNEARQDSNHLVHVREIPVVPLGSLGEHLYQPDTRRLVLNLEHLLHYDGDIDRDFWSDISSTSNGWGDWRTSSDDSEALNDMEPGGYASSVQSAEIATNESDSQELLDYEAMMASELPPAIPVEICPVAANLPTSVSSVHQQPCKEPEKITSTITVVETSGQEQTAEPPFMELIRSVRADMTKEQPNAQLSCGACVQNELPANTIVDNDTLIRQKKTAVRPSQQRSPCLQVASCSSSVSTSGKRKADIQHVILEDQDSDSDRSDVFSPPPPLHCPKRRRVQLNDDLFIKPLTPCDELRFMARDLHFKWITIDEADKRMKDIFHRAKEMLEFWSKRQIECDYIALMATIRQETVLQLIYSLMIEENPNDSENDEEHVTQNGWMSDVSDDSDNNDNKETTHVGQDDSGPAIETYWVSSDSEVSDDDENEECTHVSDKDGSGRAVETYWVSLTVTMTTMMAQTKVSQQLRPIWCLLIVLIMRIPQNWPLCLLQGAIILHLALKD